MQDETTSHRIHNIFESIFKVYGHGVIGLGYLKLAGGDVYLPDLNP